MLLYSVPGATCKCNCLRSCSRLQTRFLYSGAAAVGLSPSHSYTTLHFQHIMAYFFPRSAIFCIVVVSFTIPENLSRSWFLPLVETVLHTFINMLSDLGTTSSQGKRPRWRRTVRRAKKGLSWIERLPRNTYLNKVASPDSFLDCIETPRTGPGLKSQDFEKPLQNILTLENVLERAKHMCHRAAFVDLVRRRLSFDSDQNDTNISQACNGCIQ